MNFSISISKVSTKKWLLLLPLFIGSFALLLIFFINIVIDPYGEYDFVHTALNKKKYFADANTTSVMLAQHLKKAPYTLVFGTSRSNHISDKFLQTPILNFSSSLYGRPTDVLFFLKHLSNEQRKNISEIYYLVDLGCMIDSHYNTDPSRFTFDYYFKTILSLSRKKLLRSFNTIMRNLFDKGGYYIDHHGAVVTRVFSDYEPTKEDLEHNRNAYYFSCEEKAMDALSEIDAFCRQNQIGITYFTDIFSSACLQHINFDCLSTFLTKVTNHLPALYCMMYIPEYSCNFTNFYDRDHHKDNITEIQCMILKSEEKERYKVTKEGVQEYLISLKKSQAKRESIYKYSKQD